VGKVLPENTQGFSLSEEEVVSRLPTEVALHTVFSYSTRFCARKSDSWCRWRSLCEIFRPMSADITEVVREPCARNPHGGKVLPPR
jgi:hypothetical protein